MLKCDRVNLKNVLLVFLILQPFFDSYLLYSDEVINYIGFSPSTILRFGLIGLIFVYLFYSKIKKKENLKENKYIFIYGVIVILYAVIHHFINININENLLSSTFKYNLVTELLYLLRLVYPFILMYIVYLMKITRKEFKFVIQTTSIIFSLILLILNLFVISKTSYFSNYIRGNLFDWFDSDISRYYLAGKGWYNSANQAGGLILTLLPLVFYFAFEELKKFDLIVLLLLILSSYSLGTRVSCVGISLVLIFLMITLYAFKYYKKEKIIKKDVKYSIIVITFSLFVFNYAPIVNLSGNNIISLLHLGKVVNDNSNEDIILLNPDYDNSDSCEFLKKTSTNIEYYEDIYKCSENKEFWDHYVQNNYYKYTNNRLMEKLITSTEYSKIKSPEISLFGMGRSRFENAIMYLERDIIVHYYTLGILGILVFIMPYFIICGYIFIKKIFDKTFCYKYFCLIISIILPIAVSVLTGHIIDELFIILYLGFILGYITYIFNNKEDQEMLEEKIDNRKKILFVVDENRMGGASVLLKDIVTKLDSKKNRIDILVLHDVDDNLKDLSNNVNVIYGTNFFEAIDYNINYLIKNKKIKLLLKKSYLVLLMKTCLIKNRIVKERKKILKYDYDVEIAFKDGFTAIFTAYGNSKKKIHWLHYEYKKYNANGNYSKLFNNILPKFNKIVAVSENVMNDFNNIYHLDNKTMVIPNLIDSERILIKSNEKCSRKLKKDKINIISVGRLHECKGFDRIIKAIGKLNNNEKNKINVEIYGDGSEKEELQNLINKFDLNNIITLKGKTNNPYKYIKGNDLFILPSRFETFGLVIVESMLLGVPVFALENSNTNNLIKNKINGYIVKNTDEDLLIGLKYLINNKNEIYKYKNNLKNYKYDNDKIIKEIKKLIND